MTVYNKTAPATGSLEFPLNYALEPFSCHFELSRQPAVGQGPPYALSGTFDVAIDSNAKPVTWSQNTGNSSTASTGTNTNTSPQSTASPTPSEPTSAKSTESSTPEPTAGTKASESNGLSQGAKAGIGVGVTLGVLAFVAAAAGFFMLRRRRKNISTRQTENYNPQIDESFAPPQRNAPGYATSKMSLSEMPGNEKVHEKDSDPVAKQTIGELEAPRY